MKTSRVGQLILVSMLLLSVACNIDKQEKKTDSSTEIQENRLEIAKMLDSFNVAAAEADYNRYMDFFTDDAVFLGTDATEYWNKKAFMIWAKPHFDAKRTWNFNAIDRHIYFDQTPDLAWFDELLSTQMKICRGSGVVVKQNGRWQVKQYVLSMTIPNDLVDPVVMLKTPLEDSIIRILSGK